MYFIHNSSKGGLETEIFTCNFCSCQKHLCVDLYNAMRFYENYGFVDDASAVIQQTFPCTPIYFTL